MARVSSRPRRSWSRYVLQSNAHVHTKAISLTIYTSQFKFSKNRLTSHINGTYATSAPLKQITIAGIKNRPRGIRLRVGGSKCDERKLAWTHTNDTLSVSGLENFSKTAFEGALDLRLVY